MEEERVCHQPQKRVYAAGVRLRQSQEKVFFLSAWYTWNHT